MIWPGYSELPAVQKMTFAEHPSGGLRQRIGSDLLSETGLSLLNGFLTYNPARRVTADAALEHAYFKVNNNNSSSKVVLIKKNIINHNNYFKCQYWSLYHTRIMMTRSF